MTRRESLDEQLIVSTRGSSPQPAPQPVSGFGHLLIVLDSCEGTAMARSISTGVFTFHEPGFEQYRRRAAEARWNINEAMPDTVSGTMRGRLCTAAPSFESMLNTPLHACVARVLEILHTTRFVLKARPGPVAGFELSKGAGR